MIGPALGQNLPQVIQAVGANVFVPPPAPAAPGLGTTRAPLGQGSLNAPAPGTPVPTGRGGQGRGITPTGRPPRGRGITPTGRPPSAPASEPNTRSGGRQRSGSN